MTYLDVAKDSLDALRGGQSGCGPVASAMHRGDWTVAAMSLDEFAQAGLIIRAHSELLGSAVLFVSDAIEASPERNVAVVRAHDLRKLAIFGPVQRSHSCRLGELLRQVYKAEIVSVDLHTYGGKSTTRQVGRSRAKKAKEAKEALRQTP